MTRLVLTLTLGALLVLPATAAQADSSRPAAIPAMPASSPERYYKDGYDYQQHGDFARAAQSYQAAIRLREAYPEAWNGLGYALRQQGKLQDALKAYERALTLRPNYGEALEYLGEAYIRMGRLDDARRVLARLEPLDREEAAKLRAAIEAKPK